MLYLFVPFKLIWNLDTAFTAVVFYGMGFWLRKKFIMQSVEIYSWKKKIVCLMCSVLCSYIAIRYNDTFVNMDANQYGNIFTFYLGAFSGIVTWYLVAAFIKENKILCFLGRNTMPVIGFNYFINYVVAFLMNTWLIDILCLYAGGTWEFWNGAWGLKSILVGMFTFIFISIMYYLRGKNYVGKYIFGDIRQA